MIPTEQEQMFKRLERQAAAEYNCPIMGPEIRRALKTKRTKWEDKKREVTHGDRY